MNNDITIPDRKITVFSAAKRREWLGWLGSMCWLYFMMYGYDVFMSQRFVYGEGSRVPFYYMVVFTLALLFFGLCFSRDVEKLSHIAFFSAPSAIFITFTLPFLPPALGAILYVLSPILVAPLVLRRVYGVFNVGNSKNELTRYISAISVCVLLFALWIIIRPSKEIAFLVPALFLIMAWIGIRRTIIVSSESITVDNNIRSTKIIYYFVLAVAAVLVFWTNLMGLIIHSHTSNIGFETSNLMLTLLSYILPAASFFMYGLISEKGYERIGFVCAALLLVLGIILALLPNHDQIVLFLILTTNSIGTYFEFFILTIPIKLLASARHPLLTPALGILANLISSALLYIPELWLPQIFQKLGAPVIISAAISVIICIILVFLLFEHYQVKTLSDALCTFLYKNELLLPSVHEHDQKEELATVGFTQQEIEVSLMLIDGKSRSEITRRLHLKAETADLLMKSIQYKISGVEEPNPVISAISKKYKLTKRETEMLLFLQDELTNARIAAELVLSESTVKNHVSNLMKKLPISNRKEIPKWIEEINDQLSDDTFV